ncbi:MAG TPA: TIGR00341 family protein [Anaerolineae bacterium]|nr:TIGR00341 family protein [Anaerolineae bacterium]
MALRLMDVVVPTQEVKEVRRFLQEHEDLDVWQVSLEEDLVLIRVLLASDRIESITDELSDRLQDGGFRIVLVPVQGTVPVHDAREEEEEHDDETPLGRVSREELYNAVTRGAELTPFYVISVALSSLVAAIGLRENNVAVIIGAMVLAPLLGPNIAFALASTLGDLRLVARSARAGAVGLIGGALLGVVIGLLYEVDPTVSELAARTEISLANVALALAAGAAGALAFSQGISTTLVGVMVSAALLPPLVAAGLFAGAGYLRLAAGALMLLAINIVSLNLAGVVVFLIQGIRPRTWYEAEKAQTASRVAIAFWVVLLILLIALVFVWREQVE